MSSNPAASRTASVAVALGLFTISAAILALEVLQTRILTYCLDPLLLYAAVPLALLGIGASGTALSLWQGWRRARLGSLCALCSVGFAISLVLAHMLFAYLSGDRWVSTESFAGDGVLTFGMNLPTIVMMGGLAVPYFFAGATVTACLASSGEGVHGTYFVNLLGSALGCFVVFFAIEPLGAPALLVMIAILGVLAGSLFLLAGSGRLVRTLCIAGAAITMPAVAVSDRLFPFSPDPAGQLAYLIRLARKHPEYREQRVFEAWDPTGRIEFHRFAKLDAMLPEPVPFLFYSQDGSAGSLLFGVGDDLSRAKGLFDRTLYGAGYHLRGTAQTRKVLIIGLGGGPDVMTALHFGAESIVGVEINASTIRAVSGPLADFAGDPYGRAELTLAHMDGRTFVRSTDRKFDLIVMSGVDTKSILAAGSLAINENHLYTVEAFGEYLDHLEPGGHLAFLRFTSFDRLRLLSLGVSALRARGVAHPERHFVVLKQAHLWTSVIIGRESISADQVARIRAWTEDVPAPDTGIRLPVYDVLGLSLSAPPELVYPGGKPEKEEDAATFLAAVIDGQEQDFIDRHPLNLSPTTDDRPFFFDGQRRDRLLSSPANYYRLLASLLGIMALLAFLGIAAPPAFLRRTRTPCGRLLRTALYFSCLGFGFMILEIGFVQRLVLFLGHQTYAITVVLATLLVAAGIGSRVAGRSATGAAKTVQGRAVPAILLLGTLLLLASEHLAPLCASLPLGARIGLTAMALFPVGLCLGIPFPTGLRALAARAPFQVPWAIGANGFASVIGASAALPVAMLFGYRILIVSGFVLYLVAAMAFPTSRGRTGPTASSG